MQFGVVGAILERFSIRSSSDGDLALLRTLRRLAAGCSGCNAEIF